MLSPVLLPAVLLAKMLPASVVHWSVPAVKEIIYAVGFWIWRAYHWAIPNHVAASTVKVNYTKKS